MSSESEPCPLCGIDVRLGALPDHLVEAHSTGR